MGTPFSWEETLASILPKNTLSIFLDANINFLSFYVFLVITGVTLYLTKDKVISLKEFLYSTGRLFYRMNAYVVDFSFLSFFFLTGLFLSNVHALTTFTSFIPLILYLFSTTTLIILGIIPLLMQSLFGIKQPRRLLLAFKKTLSYSFLSQDRLGSLSFLIRESRENCLVPRYLSSAQAPLYALFFRGGNAFVTIITFMTLIKSYSSLSMGVDQILGLCFFTFASSFFLVDGQGLFFLGISWLGMYYGNNMDQAHLNLIPVIMFIGGFSAFLDTYINAYFLVGISESMRLKSHYLA